MYSIKKIQSQLKSLYEKGAAHLFIGNFLIKFIGLFGSIFIVRFLTKNEYGLLGYAENMYSYGYIFVGLGLAISILRYGIIIKDPGELKGLYNYIYKTQTIINLLLVCCICFISIIYPHPKQYTGSTYLLIILCIGLPFQDLTSTNLTIERTKMNNRRYMYFSLMAAFLSVFARVVGAKIGGVNGTVIGKVFVEICVCIVIFILVYKRCGYKVQEKKLDRKTKKEILLYSVNNMLANGIWTLFMITEVYLIGVILKEPNTLADYKVAYVIPSNMAIITSSIAVFITPYFIQNENNLEWIRENYFKVFKANLLIMGVLALFLFILSPQLILFLYGEKYINVVPLMRILLIAHFINAGIKSLHVSLLAAMGCAKENMIISIVGFVLQILSASIALFKFGVIGLAVNNVIMYALMSTTVMFIFWKKYKIRLYRRKSNDKY